MEVRSIFANVSPLDHRYSLSERGVFEVCGRWLSEEAQAAVCVKAEAALVKALLALEGGLTAEKEAALDALEGSVSPEEVYAEEEKTRHFVRALVNTLKRRFLADAALAPLAPLVHLGATSVDILDTGFAYRLRGVTREAVLPGLRELEAALCAFTEREAETAQVGRTHGQHAVPITAGFAMAEYVSRLGKCIVEIEKRAADLRGKLSGAVGAYNATSMLVRDPRALEAAYLGYLGLERSEHATQLVEPEYLLRLLLEFNVAFGVIANLADDCRNLQRTEIGELREGFAEAQVGSSTMPQKRNPWNSEHVKSMWKEFSPRVVTFFMDQISDHQRDLTNSASQRFIAEYVTGFCMAVSRMTDVVRGLGADRKRMLANLRSGGGGVPGGVLAEPAYILLAGAGEGGEDALAVDAHETIRRVTVSAEREGLDFAAALERESEAYSRIAKRLSAKFGIDAREFFRHPEQYRGLAAQIAHELAAKWGGSHG